ncbi:MAG: MmcQ/YjbR family DNA-binding protein [Actinomycetes bacterium]
MSSMRHSSADHVREVALALPETTEQLTWEVHPTFRVRNKIFVILGEDGTTATVKASLDDQKALIQQSPDTYSVAAHVGRFGWVSVVLGRADKTEIAELVEEAWRAVAPKRLVAATDRGRA